MKYTLDNFDSADNHSSLSENIYDIPLLGEGTTLGQSSPLENINLLGDFKQADHNLNSSSLLKFFSSLKILERKLKNGEQITYTDCPAQYNSSLNEAPIAQKQYFIAIMLAASNHTNKSQVVEQQVFHLLSTDKGLFKDITLKEEELELIASKLNNSYSKQASSVLEAISKQYPLPQSILAKLASHIRDRGGVNNHVYLNCIKESLAHGGELLSKETANILSNYITSSTKSFGFELNPGEYTFNSTRLKNMQPDEAISHLEALALLLQSGKITENQVKNLAILKNHPDEATKKLGTELYKEAHIAFTIHKIPTIVIKGLKDNLLEILHYSKFKARYLSLLYDRLDICQGHLAYLQGVMRRYPSIDLEEHGILDDLSKGLIKTADANNAYEIYKIICNKSKNISSETAGALIKKLPFGNETLDQNLLGLTFNSIIAGKITSIDKEAYLALQDISAGNDNAEIVRKYAAALLKKAGEKFPHLTLNSLPLKKDLATKENQPDLEENAIPPNANDILKSDVKSLSVLKQELSELNHANGEVTNFLSSIEEILSAMKEAADKDSVLASQGKKIQDFQAPDLHAWSKAIREKEGCGSDHLPEIIAGICKAVELDKGYAPREIQILSVLMLIDAEHTHKGRLLQIKTGEGKSTITAMLAAFKVLVGKK